MDKLSNIIAFSIVAETASFAAAAKRLNIAPSVVTKRIQDLEAALGVRLFQRTTRHVRLTDAGYEYLEHTRRLIDELAEVEDNLRLKNENPVGELNISAPVSFGTLFLGPALAAYMEKYKDVTLRLSLTDQMVDLAQGGVDVAIAVGEIPYTAAVTRKIADSRRVVVASPAYIAAHGAPQKPQDLISHNCMTYSHQLDGRHWPFILGGKKYAQPVAGRFTANNGMMLKEAAVEGCGIAMLPSFLAAEDIGAGRLKILLEDFEEPSLAIQAAWVQQRYMSARTRSFIDFISGYFSSFSGKNT